MSYTKRFRIEPGSKVDLKDIDPGFHGDHASHVEAASELRWGTAPRNMLPGLPSRPTTSGIGTSLCLPSSPMHLRT
jgi:hypothetical protein